MSTSCVCSGLKANNLSSPRGKHSANSLINLSDLSAQQTSGRPAPAISWRKKSKLLDDSYLTLNDFLALQQSFRLLSSINNNSNSKAEQTLSTKESEQNPNSISVQHSPIGSLEQLTREWRTWPEYQFYSSSSELSHLQINSSRSRQFQLQPGSQVNSQQQRPNQLLELTVDESITTAVNVLSVNNLNGQFLTPDSKLRARPASVESAAVIMGRQLQIECQASNLHYDLRTLIKLFAPPSLAASASAAGSNRPTHPTFGQSWEQPGESSLASRQLVEAIEAALESSLGSSEAWSSVERSGQLLDNQPLAMWSAQNAALRQLQSLDQTTANSSSSVQVQVASGWPDKQSAASAIYQQLSRPHQLSSQSQLQQSSDGSQQPSSLVRSKLIALDVFRK